MRRLLQAVVMLLAFGGTAWADDGGDCKQMADADLSIRACSNIITTPSGKSDKDLAAAYANRGDSYYQKHDFDQAIADETKAIELYPWDVTYAIRARSYESKGLHASAIADWDKLIE